MTEFVLSLGSNLGDRKKSLQDAIRLLSEEFGTPIKVSSFYESEPWGFESENYFLNCCVKFKSIFSCEKILAITQEIEKKIGRDRKSNGTNYQSRKIDIDIVFLGKVLIYSDGMVVPHRFFQDRRFVLLPLQEISPSWIDPRSGLSIEQLIINCSDTTQLTQLK